jgi:hypothetical protein
MGEITSFGCALGFPQQLRQLGDVGGDPPPPLSPAGRIAKKTKANIGVGPPA